jgi:hypothetical protein
LFCLSSLLWAIAVVPEAESMARLAALTATASTTLERRGMGRRGMAASLDDAGRGWC